MTKPTGFTARNMVFTALMAALICIVAPFIIPLGTIPLSLATIAIYLAGAILGSKRGTAAVIIYLLIGIAGLPVFSGFTAGIAQLFSITGGYLIGYIPCAFITGVFAEMQPNKAWHTALGMTLGTLACYAIGTAWFMVYTGSEIIPALLVCVVPFITGDTVKIAAACAIAIPIRKRVDLQ